MLLIEMGSLRFFEVFWGLDFFVWFWGGCFFGLVGWFGVWGFLFPYGSILLSNRYFAFSY